MAESTIMDEERKQKTRLYIEQIQNLPSFPMVMMQVSRMLDNPNTSAAELGKLISKDQGLVTKILRIANSPLFGLPRKVSTIEFAIVILGFSHIKNIIIALSALESFASHDAKNWNKNKFWMHSVMTASLSKKIAEDLGFRKSGEVFIAGLLHDLGISIIQRYLNKEFENILSLVDSGVFTHLEAEEETMQLTHQDIGEFLAGKWNLPKSLGETILNHHKPSNAEKYVEICAIVHIADYLTQHYNVGNFDWDNNIELDLGVIDILNLGDENYLQELIKSYESSITIQKDNLLV